MTQSPETDQVLRIYPKLKHWEASVQKILGEFAEGRLRTALMATFKYMVTHKDKGAYWVNPACVTNRPRKWWGRWFTNGSQNLTLSSTVRNGLHNVGLPFAAISETRYAMFSPHWWQVRSLRQRMMRITAPSQLMVHLGRLMMEYYHRALPMETVALQWLLEHLYGECPQLYWSNNLDGTIEILGTYTNEGGNYVTLWTLIELEHLRPEAIQRTV